MCKRSRGSGTREEPGTLTQGGALFFLVPLVWESNPKLQGGARPNHQPMARNGLRTRPHGVDPMAADSDGRRIPLATPFVSIPRHTLILLARASAQYSLPRPRNCNFAHASRSDGPRNLVELQTLHPAQPSALFLYCSDFTLTRFHTGRSLDHHNPTKYQ